MSGKLVHWLGFMKNNGTNDEQKLGIVKNLRQHLVLMENKSDHTINVKTQSKAATNPRPRT